MEVTFWKQFYAQKQLYCQGGLICSLWGQFKWSFCTACTLVHSPGPAYSNPIISLDEETFGQKQKSLLTAESGLLFLYVTSKFTYDITFMYNKIAKCGRLWSNHSIIHLFVSLRNIFYGGQSMQLFTPSFPRPLQRICRVICEKISKPAVHTHVSWDSISWSWKLQKLSISVYLPVSLLCLRLKLLEKTKDFVMKQNSSMPNAQFNQDVLFFQYFVNSSTLSELP